VFLPLALPERTDGHISVEIVSERLPPAVQRHLRAWLQLAGCLIYAAMARAAWLEAMTKYASGARVIESGLPVLIWPGYFVLPVGCGLIALVLFYKFAAYLTGLPSGIDGLPHPGRSGGPRP
jgi:TRAP-type C4-dicarboxylate transport system permease small subunit